MQCINPSRRLFTQGLALAAGAAAFPRAFAADGTPLLVMAGAGYRRPVEALCAAFSAQTGASVERSYGNLQQLFAQIRASGRVDALIGDEELIAQNKDLDLPQRVVLGQSTMVLAWRRKLLGRYSPQPITDPVRDLPSMQTLCMTNPQTIFGRAGKAWLQAKGLWEPLQDKLKIVQTLPQVSAYLTSGQIDAGFLNLTEALAVKGQLGGYIALQPGPGSYAPIDIIAAMPAASAGDPATASARAAFARFLQTDPARATLRDNGL